jgi:hypothetical protein
MPTLAVFQLYCGYKSLRFFFFFLRFSFFSVSKSYLKIDLRLSYTLIDLSSKENAYIVVHLTMFLLMAGFT